MVVWLDLRADGTPSEGVISHTMRIGQKISGGANVLNELIFIEIY
jgi:hypothetical protein